MEGEKNLSKTFKTWFNNLSLELARSKQLNILTTSFQKCRSDAERVAFVLKTEAICSFLNNRRYEGPSPKSDSLSEKFRTEGNNYFKRKNFGIALCSYTESVFHASCSGGNTVNLSLAFANRSAVLFQVDDFQGCLSDAKEALALQYPDRLRYKLLDRLGRAQLKLGYKDSAKASFELALSSIELNTDINPLRRSEITSELFRLTKISSGEDGKRKDAPNSNPSFHKLPEIEQCDINPRFPCARSSFDVKYDSYLGRCAIATRDIHAGELILIEKPFASVLLTDKKLSHCHHCMTRCSNLIGCLQCSSVGFCNSGCREAAWKEYHWIECKFIDILRELDVGLGSLSLRMVIKSGFKNLLLAFGKSDIKDDAIEGTSFGLNEKGCYDSLDYTSIYSLIGHSADRPLSDLFRRSVMAVLLLKFVENDPFFTEETLKHTPQDKKVCIASHILKNLQMLPCNAHEVSELQVNKVDIAGSVLKEIGSAIYATLSLLNHSCDPSVVRHSYKDSCALRAIKFIPKGGEIIDNYGALYPVSLIKDRQSMLSEQYYFDCLCEACKNKWLLYPDLPNGEPIIKCPDCGRVLRLGSKSQHDFTRCQSCKLDMPITSESFNSSRHDFEMAMESVLSGGDAMKNLPYLLNFLQLVCKYVQLPWQPLNNCQEIVKQCFSMVANHHFV